jgi:hypothetical protein
MEPFLTTTEMAGELNITYDLMKQLAADGILPCAKNLDGDTVHGRFDERLCYKAYIQYLRNRVKERPSSAVAYDIARTQRMQQQAEIAFMNKEMLAGRLCVVEEANNRVAEMILAIRNKILGAPPRVAWLVLDKQDHEEVTNILQVAAEELLRDLATLTVEPKDETETDSL